MATISGVMLRNTMNVSTFACCSTYKGRWGGFSQLLSPTARGQALVATRLHVAVHGAVEGEEDGEHLAHGLHVNQVHRLHPPSRGPVPWGREKRGERERGAGYPVNEGWERQQRSPGAGGTHRKMTAAALTAYWKPVRAAGKGKWRTANLLMMESRLRVRVCREHGARERRGVSKGGGRRFELLAGCQSPCLQARPHLEVMQ